MAKKELTPAQLRIVQAVQPYLRSGAVRIACSGGADSLSLVAAVAHLVARGRVAVPATVHVVDHQLQDGSAQVATRVKKIAATVGLPATVHTVTVDDDGDGMEAAARLARYRALANQMAPDDVCLLGHTLDDQAETVLLGLARGSGSRSISGMAPSVTHFGATFVRPLLGIRRQDTVEACSDWDLPVWQDPQNEDPRFTRVRIRHTVMPTLERELGPGVAEALARTADLARADADVLDAQATRISEQFGDELPVPLVARLPEAIATRVLRNWLISHNVDQPSQERIQAVMGLVQQWRGQRGIDVPGGHQIVRSGDKLIFNTSQDRG